MCVLKRQEGVVVGEKVVPIRSKAYPPNTQLENWKLPLPSHSVFVLVHNHYGHARSHDHLVMSWPNALLAWFQTPTTLCVCVYARVHSCPKSVRTYAHTRKPEDTIRYHSLCTVVGVIFVKCDLSLAWNLQVGYTAWSGRFRDPPIPDYEVLGLWSSNSFFFFVKDFILD